MNQALTSLHGGLLKITLTVSLTSYVFIHDTQSIEGHLKLRLQSLLSKELSLFHKLTFSNPYIFAT